jgi:hypothetical protein
MNRIKDFDIAKKHLNMHQTMILMNKRTKLAEHFNHITVIFATVNH